MNKGNDLRAYGWGCATIVAVISIVTALAWYATFVR